MKNECIILRDISPYTEDVKLCAWRLGPELCEQKFRSPMPRRLPVTSSGYSCRTKRKPASTEPCRRAGSVPARSVRKPRSRVRTCETLTTESRGTPEENRYQESLSRERIWARCNAESTFAGRREYTSFRRSVTVFVWLPVKELRQCSGI